MNKFFYILICFTIAINTSARIFTSHDEQKVEAEIISFNYDDNLVELKRENGKKFKVSSEIFIEEDQQFILNWSQTRDFLNTRLFDINCVKKVSDEIENSVLSVEWDDGSSEEISDFREIKNEYVYYDVIISNDSDVITGPIKIEYRIFYEKELGINGKLTSQNIFGEGIHNLGTIKGRKKINFTTDSIVLKRVSYNTSDYVYSTIPVDTSDKLEGIWLRATIVNSDGKKITRDHCDPESISNKKIWN